MALSYAGPRKPLGKRPMTTRIQWKPGSLQQRLEGQTAHGLSTGDLQPIRTEVTQISDGDIDFIVYILANLSAKEKSRKEQGKTKPDNPFLPYEPDLYVSDITDTHLCLLNKFNVVENHFLIVTREFESQENWLTMADFDALNKCLGEVDGLAFYNGGQTAGSSQPHKHLQVVPRTGAMRELPIEIALKKARVSGGNRWSPMLPYRHAIAKFPPAQSGFSGKALTKLYMSRYLMLLNAVGIDASNLEGPQTAPYNLLCTRQWMMLVPRSQEEYEGIPVNSLGFVGSLLVKNRDELKNLEEIGPLNVLRQVGFERDEE